MVDGFLQQPAFSGQNRLLRNHLEAASLLGSRGARFGVPTADADDKFSLPPKPLTRIHIDSLRSRGISTLFRLLSSYMLLYELFSVHSEAFVSYSGLLKGCLGPYFHSQ